MAEPDHGRLLGIAVAWPIAMTIIVANLLGDALRDFPDPKMKRQVE